MNAAVLLVRHFASERLAEGVGAGDAVSFRVLGEEVNSLILVLRMYRRYSDLIEIAV